MRIAVVQFTPNHRALQANLERIEGLIANTDADLIVFPELATTGYLFLEPQELEALAMPATDHRLQHLLSVAAHHHRVIVLGFAEHDGSLVYNSSLTGGYGVEQIIYRKTHLFYKERLVFAPGNTGFLVSPLPHLDCNLGVMICYDWRFPESARTLALRGTDVIAAPSNLVTELWPRVMPARAAENKVYLAVANRVGTETSGDDSVTFNGRSTVYGFDGTVLERVEEEDEHPQRVITAEIDPAATRDKSFNAFNNIFTDRRPEMYA
jgi:predicted amidohydrolase